MTGKGREIKHSFVGMDPGRYGLHQGWDNNSVIVVSSLNNSPIWNMGIIIQRNNYYSLGFQSHFLSEISERNASCGGSQIRNPFA